MTYNLFFQLYKANSQPRCYMALTSLLDIFAYIFTPVYPFCDGDKNPPQNIKLWKIGGKEIRAINKFKKDFFIKLIDDTDEDIGPNYSGKKLAYLVADAYIQVRNGETTSLSNFSCYRDYLASGGKAQLTYEEAVQLLPTKDSPLYKFNPKFWDTRAKQLKQLRDVRAFLQEHFTKLPQQEIEQCEYEEVKALYFKVMNMYAYEVLFDVNYM